NGRNHDDALGLFQKLLRNVVWDVDHFLHDDATVFEAFLFFVRGIHCCPRYQRETCCCYHEFLHCWTSKVKTFLLSFCYLTNSWLKDFQHVCVARGLWVARLSGGVLLWFRTKKSFCRQRRSGQFLRLAPGHRALVESKCVVDLPWWRGSARCPEPFLAGCS